MIRLETKGDKAFRITITVFVALLVFLCFYPFLYVVSNSFSNPAYVLKQEVYLLPKGFSLGAYKLVYENAQVWSSYRNTIFYTFVGTLINMFTTFLFAYPLSRADFSGRKFFLIVITITMFFSGGLIPLFIVINQIGLYDSLWAVILPSAISTYNVIITRTFMQGLPLSLQESAMLDGCNDVRILLRIVLPLSMPIVAVVGLYCAVNFWNMYFLPMVFTPSVDKHPLQLYLMKVVIQNSQEGLGSAQGYERLMSGAQLKYSVIIVSILPIVSVYPFLQKYFIKGIMIGALKG
jgi:putative aldouronate transport system permease protein